MRNSNIGAAVSHLKKMFNNFFLIFLEKLAATSNLALLIQFSS